MVKNKILLLFLVVIFFITTYLYIFQFIETLFWVHRLDPGLIEHHGVATVYAYEEIAPTKKIFLLIQILQASLLLFYSKKLRNENKLKPFSSVIYFIALTSLILYILIGIIASITPYTGVIG